MDVEVIFQRSGGDPFTMKVDVYLDTVPKIKAKIQKLQAIPISQQTIIFHGKILSDHYDILLTNIYHKSSIQLLIVPPPEFEFKLAEKEFPPLMDGKTAEIAFPPLTQFKFITMAGDEQLPPSSSETSSGSGGASSNAVTVNANRKGRAIENPPEDVNLKADGSKKRPRVSEQVNLTVVVDYHGERTPVTVNRDDRVAILRPLLSVMEVRVPEGPYFFIHDQDTMEEDRSFRWHRVRHGDEISVFAGYVTRAPD